MTLLLRLAMALALAGAPLTAPAAPVPSSSSATAPMTLPELMRAAALDEVFSSYGEAIAASPEAQGLPVNRQFLDAWKGAAAESFAPAQLQQSLQSQLEDQFSDAERAELGQFFGSPFGQRISAIENRVQHLPAAEQLAARDEGLTLLEAVPADARRPAQIEEILELVSAEIGRTMLAESMRAMLAGMMLSGASGDIEVPWDQIDAQLSGLLPSFEAEVQVTQRGMMAYAYQDLSEAEVETYLDFLRTDTARKFYAVVGYSVGLIIHEAMGRFGEAFAERMNRVSI